MGIKLSNKKNHIFPSNNNSKNLVIITRKQFNDKINKSTKKKSSILPWMSIGIISILFISTIFLIVIL